LDGFELNAFFAIMNNHFAKMSYHLFLSAKEGFYQAVFFTFLEKSGITTMTEVATNIGRIDLACETHQAICIFELKLDQNADIALTQAETKKYRERFSSQDKPTLVIGVNFSSESRHISDWKGMVFSPKGRLIKELHPN
ncbi:MAG: PD-(D/E)XK nuclease domain-containing protein, partial [Chlamydiota bacterium]